MNESFENKKLSFGKYKGWIIKLIPKDYLIWFYKQNEDNSNKYKSLATSEQTNLMIYIKKNILHCYGNQQR